MMGWEWGQCWGWGGVGIELRLMGRSKVGVGAYGIRPETHSPEVGGTLEAKLPRNAGWGWGWG